MSQLVIYLRDDDPRRNLSAPPRSFMVNGSISEADALFRKFLSILNEKLKENPALIKNYLMSVHINLAGPSAAIEIPKLFLMRIALIPWRLTITVD